MSINAIGAREPIRASINADVSYSASIKEDGSPRGLSAATLTIIIQDDNNGSVKTIGEYAQTITDAAAGLFQFYIPKDAFKNQAGECLSWNLVILENSTTTSLALGTVIIEGVE